MSTEHLTQLWIQIIKHLALSNDSKKIFSFLNKCGIVEINDDTKKIVVGVGNEFVLMQVKKFFLEGLNEAVKSCYNDQYTVEIQINPTGFVPVELKGSLELQVSKAKVSIEWDDGDDVLWLGKSPSPAAQAQKVYNKHKNALTEQFGVLFDTKFQFTNFVVGSNNEFAYSLLYAIANQPGVIHNPFFLHGNVGLGKTHLLQATGNTIIANFPDKTVLYLPTSKLVTEIIESIKSSSVNKLLAKFEGVDVLILDDIQVIAGKNACQDILLWLFNDFVDKKKQVIFSSDKPPRSLMQIEDRLKTRFALGAICEISQPDFETRMAILQAKRESKGEQLSSEYYELIAQTITDNIRELEGITNTLIMKKQLLGKDLTWDDVVAALKSLGYTPRASMYSDGAQQASNDKMRKNKTQEFDQMVEKIAAYYNLSTEEIIWEGRRKEVAVARQMCMYVAKKHFGWTLEKIGWFFSKNHSSVIYSLDKFEELLRDDEVVKEDWIMLGMS